MRYYSVTKDNTILEVKGLSVAFGGQTVVENISYSLERGRTLGIVGESGSGKSVSSMALMGLLPKKATVSGQALLTTNSLTEKTETNRSRINSDDSVRTINLIELDEEGFRSIRGKRISMVFQEPMTSLNPVQKCGKQVLEMMNSLTHSPSPKKRGEQRERVIELFREVLLPRPEKIFDSYPHELSGGQKQRVMIAMALINHPDIIIADEPTTALDVTVQKTILELLRSLQQKYGTSIIFISHDLGVISQVADDILVMYRGKVVEQGPAAEILHHPKEPYTKGLLDCRPPLDSKPYRLHTVEDYLSNSEFRKLNYENKTSNNSKFKIQNSKLLEVRDLSVTYTLKRSILGRPLQTMKGVDGVSFDIMEGETLGLVGESGCGKTTLGRSLLRLIEHSSGTVSYRGTPLDKLTEKQMRALRPKLQIIFQDPYSSLNPRITIGEAIAEPLRVHRKALTEKNELPESRIHSDDSVRELMRQVGLDPEWYSRYPHELSGGQRQRVCIARALILQPELVVCDESVSALDVSVQAQVINLLNDLKEQFHYTYLFITHDLAVAHYISDRIMVMQQGRIVESGTADDIFLNPKTDYTRTLLDAIPRIDG